MRTLITADDIKRISNRPDKTLSVPPKTIITPAAKDAARDCGVRIVFEDQPPAAITQAADQQPVPAQVPVSTELVARIVP